MEINREQFAIACADQAVFYGVNCHFLMAVAEVMTGIKDDTVDGKVGPYGFTPTFWAANKNPPETEIDLDPPDINEFGIQCVLAAALARKAMLELRGQLGRMPSAKELFERWPNDPAQLPNLQAAFDSTAQFIEPAMTEVIGEIEGPGGILGEMIGKVESRGNYNAFNRGTAGDSSGQQLNLTGMTIGQIKARQAATGADKLVAVGKYQIVPSTMKETVQALGIPDGELYSPLLQERMFRQHLVRGKQPRLRDFIMGVHNDLDAAQTALANEFAAVPKPGGGSAHAGVGGNAALTTTAATRTAINAERAKFAQLRTSGMTANDAWTALSPGLVG